MNKHKALEIVKKQLTEHRYEHTIGVMNTALDLAKRYGADTEKVQLAAIFHDYAKFRPKEEMKSAIIARKMPSDLLQYGSELWHAPVGAYLVQQEVGIHDDDVLLAIQSHTSGRVGMTLMEKIIFLADYIEPGRRFAGVDEVRELAGKDLDLAVLQSLANTISFLVSRKQLIYPETLHTYNWLLSVMNKEECAT
jgi:predicted HD superfamily hydrolase involved in NAD metabolism